MRTYKRICIENYSLRDSIGQELNLIRGHEYLTSREEHGKVMVFTNFWVDVPVTLFAGENLFTP